ncbi:hypothetical protein D5H75_29735 [Bailinhaonella thermotolerans]|uniref:Uncharacterized protein n=2 Tax=Bailinhaonella thermotolerans TaxID=1070861 RepID=A0A3A4AEP0_9ACTN|nr:hypothetical protein D5H75_29735 [Bailinhaonella thermotolerans]
MQPGETPPAASATDHLVPGGGGPQWVFNPEYQRLVELWNDVLPMLEELTKVLDKPYAKARSRDVWDAPVADRHVQDMGEWRKRLEAYRSAVLAAISEKAAETPRWIPAGRSAVPSLLPR